MAKPNVLLIILDSVRRDRVSCYGYRPGVTPHLDAIAATGVRFDNVISESSWTLPVALSLASGLTPREHQGEIYRKLPENIPTLAELLQQAGYDTFSVTNNMWLAPRSGMTRGFQRWHCPLQDRRLWASAVMHIAQPLGLLAPGGTKMVGRFCRWLPRARVPFFALLWINDAHHPYQAPPAYVRRFVPEPLSRRRRLQLAQWLRNPRHFVVTAGPEEFAAAEGLCTSATAYVDSLVGRVWEALHKQKMAEETLMIVASDHGDMLGEHGLMGHAAPSGLYQPLIHVPLIISGPGFPPGAICSALVQHTDLTETIAAMAGVAEKLPPSAAPRQNLLQALAGPGRPVAICEREKLSPKSLARNRQSAPGFDFARFDCHMAAVIAGEWKLIFSDRGDRELYHLRQDPQEEKNVAAARPDLVAQLLNLWETYQQRCQPAARDGELLPEEEEILDRRLRDLGYL